jgi:hypothetical protein
MVDTTPRRRLGRRTLYAATMVAILGASVGFLFASALPAQSTVNQTSNSYGVSNPALATFSTAPTVAVAGVPASASGCNTTASPWSFGTTSGTVNLYLGASAGVTCAPNDFAEEFTFVTGSGGMPASTHFTVTVFDTYSNNSVPYSGVSAGAITTTGAVSGTTTVNVYVDFGSVAVPSGGIGTLDVVVS